MRLWCMPPGREEVTEQYCDQWHDRTTRETAGLECPYCHYLYGDAYEYFCDKYEGYTIEVECPSCDKRFMATISIRITYIGMPAVEDQEQTT